MNPLNLSSLRISAPTAGATPVTLPVLSSAESAPSTTAYAEHQPPAPAQLQTLAETRTDYLSRLPTELNSELVGYLSSSEINNFARTNKINCHMVQSGIRSRLIAKVQHTAQPLRKYRTATNRKDQYYTHDRQGLAVLSSMGIYHPHLIRQINIQQCTIEEALQILNRNDEELTRLQRKNVQIRCILEDSHENYALIDSVKCGLLTVPEMLRLSWQGAKTLEYIEVQYFLSVGLLKPSDLNKLNSWSCLMLQSRAIKSGIESGEIDMNEVIRAEDPSSRLGLLIEDRSGAQRFLYDGTLTLAQCAALSKDDCLDLNLKVVQQYLDARKMTMAEMLALSPGERRALPPLELSVDR